MRVSNRLSGFFRQISRVRPAAFLVLFLCVAGIVYLSWHASAESDPKARAIAQECVGEQKPTDCVKQKILAMVVADGDAGEAFRILRELNTKEPWMGDECADLATNVGRDLYKQRPDYHFLRLGPDTVNCNYAFLQQYVREMLSATKDTGMAKEYCASVEKSLKSVASGVTAECYRAVGQTLPFIDSDSMGNPRRMIAFAIRNCESMTSVPDERHTCVAGAFNYLDVRQSFGEYGLTIDKKDPAGICREQPPEYRGECYGSYKRVILASVAPSPDFGAEMATIQSLYPNLDKETLLVLAHTLGYDAATHRSGPPDYDALSHSCATVDTALYGQCVQGLALGFAKNGTPGEQYLEIRKLCDAAAPDLKKAGVKCLGVGEISYLKTLYSPAKFAETCALLQIEDDPLCE
ncbi:hypothetical protein A3D71_03055 [Candidatus Kaiserbacteria bacterium RIFCSPHIGHO2_02_FULL_55_20]|uniref:Uncharacterized protein n=1 Tax=Candidatus Kaiserbacteria bacterium RIFCSPHIGHO2_02_FULL_55_20 TaxID=1798497 RepID=A0A1F6DXS1_9BACT|nr:MAG: hypothetical protein A2680_00690 [Candidatus Kaiserbacteria bacterium RIFCSPHIGHO2_01_FULL_55_37]OGG66229.1 MAG: hypothetical protein A3D71_03055 [Candidatus Kaiserbacteria bacterium RIFCSPHIGHO2_02_FULL_55_20]